MMSNSSTSIKDYKEPTIEQEKPPDSPPKRKGMWALTSGVLINDTKIKGF